MDDAQITHFDALVRAGPEAREALRACLTRSPHILNQKSPGLSFSLLADYMDDAGEGNLSAMESLLAAGLDPNHELADHGNGFCILMNASYSNEPRLVALLLRHGADPNRADAKGWTPLMFAVALAETLAINATTSAEVVRMLLAAGAHKDARNAKGRSVEDILSFQRGYDAIDPKDIDLVANALREG